MNKRAAILAILVVFAAGGLFGYLFRARNTDASLVLSIKDVITDEYIAPPDTFSRVKNTKYAFDSLSTRVAIGITDAIAAYDRLPRTSESEIKTAGQVLARALHAGEAAMLDFEGTEQQAIIAQAFLHALRKAGEFNRWVEVYTKALYTHPTHRALCGLASEAIKISKAAGQQQRVLDALTYVLASPAEFAGRTAIQAALASAFASASVNLDAPTQGRCFRSSNCPQL
jgi:hypothetical protein